MTLKIFSIVTNIYYLYLKVPHISESSVFYLYSMYLFLLHNRYYTPTAYGSSSYAVVSGSICGGSPQDNTGWSGTDIQCTISKLAQILMS